MDEKDLVRFGSALWIFSSNQ